MLQQALPAQHDAPPHRASTRCSCARTSTGSVYFDTAHKLHPSWQHPCQSRSPLRDAVHPPSRAAAAANSAAAGATCSRRPGHLGGCGSGDSSSHGSTCVASAQLRRCSFSRPGAEPYPQPAAAAAAAAPGTKPRRPSPRQLPGSYHPARAASGPPQQRPGAVPGIPYPRRRRSCSQGTGAATPFSTARASLGPAPPRTRLPSLLSWGDIARARLSSRGPGLLPRLLPI